MRVRFPLSAPRAGSLTEERGLQNRVRGFDSLSALPAFRRGGSTHGFTKPVVQVRLLAEGPRPSRLDGQGRRPLTPATRVRIPRGTPRLLLLHLVALVLPDAGARFRSGTRGVRLSARAPRDTNRISAAMVQQQNARLPASRSGCDSRWPLRCDPRRKVGLISPIKVVRLHPQQDAELVIW
jgi:hypothetical protein